MQNHAPTMSDLVMPGPGAYRPNYNQVHQKEDYTVIDKVSHSMKTGGKRVTMTDDVRNVQIARNEVEFINELGCCDRLMRGLAVINQITELPEDQKKQKEAKTDQFKKE